MSDILPPLPLLAAFLVASFVLAVTPGPGVLYIVTRSLSRGRRSGLASMAGVALGNFCNAVGAALGLGALLAVSATAFTIVRYAGAAWLIYLGVRALLAARSPAAPISGAGGRGTPLFRDGFLVALLNPKTAIFFAAFLPQFMTPGAPALLQSVSLGALFVLIAAITDTAYVLAAGTLAAVVAKPNGAVGRLGRYAVGGAFIGLGFLAGFGGPRSGR